MVLLNSSLLQDSDSLIDPLTYVASNSGMIGGFKSSSAEEKLFSDEDSKLPSTGSLFAIRNVATSFAVYLKGIKF